MGKQLDDDSDASFLEHGPSQKNPKDGHDEGGEEGPARVLEFLDQVRDDAQGHGGAGGDEECSRSLTAEEISAQPSEWAGAHGRTSLQCVVVRTKVTGLQPSTLRNSHRGVWDADVSGLFVLGFPEQFEADASVDGGAGSAVGVEDGDECVRLVDPYAYAAVVVPGPRMGRLRALGRELVRAASAPFRTETFSCRAAARTRSRSRSACSSRHAARHTRADARRPRRNFFN
ncbi:hypothetical protein [Streptomyces sp. NPDC056287]|uniref:hypothetical protein n=1 Tax=Streptomyces sp. NPDC056287 TaxID=3345770 RepID=UPI0035E0F88C